MEPGNHLKLIQEARATSKGVTKLLNRACVELERKQRTECDLVLRAAQAQVELLRQQLVRLLQPAAAPAAPAPKAATG